MLEFLREEKSRKSAETANSAVYTPSLFQFPSNEEGQCAFFPVSIVKHG